MSTEETQSVLRKSATEVERELAKIDRFRRIASHRSNRALDYIEALLRTSERERYSYTDKQVGEIVGKLRQAIDQLEAAYAGSSTKRMRVEL